MTRTELFNASDKGQRTERHTNATPEPTRGYGLTENSDLDRVLYLGDQRPHWISNCLLGDRW